MRAMKGSGGQKPPEQEFFKKKLTEFTLDAANGGAVRHLADRGYCVSQIKKMLDFPTSEDWVRQAVWNHLLDTGVLRLEAPGEGRQEEKSAYVTEYDAYGRKSFRRVAVQRESNEPTAWKEQHFREDADGKICTFLERKCIENGEELSYASCDFGLVRKRDPGLFREELGVLLEEQRDYITGLFAERRMAYHRLNRRMWDIVSRLYCGGFYHGVCFFIKSGEKILF